MSILNWRDVAAPDFSGAGREQAVANDSMNQAFASLQNSLQGFKDARSDVADRNIINRMLTYQDPQSLQAAMSNGSIVGQDGRFARISTLAALPKEQQDMLNNSLTQAQTRNVNASAAHTEQGNTQEGILNQRANDIFANNQALQPVVTGLVNKYASQGADGVNTALHELEQHPEFAKLSLMDQATTRGAVAGGISAPVQAQNDLRNLQIAGSDAANAEAAKQAFAHLTTPGNFLNLDDQVRQAMTIQNPIVRQKVLDGIQSLHPDIPNLVAKPVSMVESNRNILGATTSNFDPNRAVYLPGGPGNKNNQNVLPEKNWDQYNVQEALTLGNTMIARQGNTPLASSAKTPYMFTNGTMQDAAQALWKSDPSFRGDTKSFNEVNLTPENQDKMAQWVFNRAIKNNNLGDVWTSLTPSDLQIIHANGNDWHIARGLIIGRENGISLDSAADTIQKIHDTRQDTQTNLDTQGANNPLAEKYAPYIDAQIGADTYKAAQYLAANAPAFKGANQNQILDLEGNIKTLINAAAKRGTPINAAQAALVLSQSTEPDSPWAISGMMNGFHNLLNPGNVSHSINGQHLNFDTINEQLDQVTKPSFTTAAQNYTGQKAKTALEQQAADALHQKNIADFRAAETNYRRLKGTPQEAEAQQIYSNAIVNLFGSSSLEGRTDANLLNASKPAGITRKTADPSMGEKVISALQQAVTSPSPAAPPSNPWDATFNR